MRPAATLTAVHRRDATIRWTRSSLVALALALLAPGMALAQEEQPEAVEDEAAESDEAGESEAGESEAGESEAGESETGELEAGEAGVLAVDGGTYEPYQRGVHDLEDLESEEPRVDTIAGSAPLSIGTSSDERRVNYNTELGFELALWLGGVVTDLDIAGGGNLVRATQRGSVGASFGFAAGLRIGPVIVGPRVGLTIDPSFLLADLGVGVEVLLMPPGTSSEVSSYVRAAVGGSLVTGLAAPLPEQRDAGVAGTVAEVAIGARWNPWRGLVIGLELAGLWHHLWREPVEACDVGCNDGTLDLLRAGESDALQLRLSLSAGWSF
jgi:hypothetical protein